jgi:hypothetical protein
MPEAVFSNSSLDTVEDIHSTEKLYWFALLILTGEDRKPYAL